MFREYRAHTRRKQTFNAAYGISGQIQSQQKKTFILTAHGKIDKFCKSAKNGMETFIFNARVKNPNLKISNEYSKKMFYLFVM